MKPWLSKSFLFVVALLCVAELVVRVFFARNMSGRFEYGYDHNASGFEEKADGTVKLVRAGGRKFHPQSFTRTKPDGVFRIMVLGDSVARGSSLRQSYPYRLGEVLQARGIKAESFNLALPGCGATRNQIILEQVLKYQPSLVVLHVNNSNEFEDEREWQRAEARRGWHPRNWPMKSLLLARLYEMKTEKVLWKWLPAEIRNLGAVNDAGDEITASLNSDNVRRWNQTVADKTAEDAALCQKASVPLLLLTQARCENGILDDHGLDALVSPLVSSNVLHLSMKEILNRPDAQKLYADGSHVRPEAHDMLAEAIAAALVKSHLANPTK